MKRKLLRLIAIPFVLLLVVSTTSCSDDSGADMLTDFFTVKKADWKWNTELERFEFTFAYSKITNYIYEYGVVHGGVFVYEGNTEYLKNMPYVQTWNEGEGVVYTETISYDIRPGNITFFVQASDLSPSRDFLETYDFKVTIFWER